MSYEEMLRHLLEIYPPGDSRGDELMTSIAAEINAVEARGVITAEVRDRLYPGFTHEVPEVERYVCFGNCESSSALSGAAISKPRRVIAERAQLPERSDA